MTREPLPFRRAAMMFDVRHSYPGADERVFTCSIGFYPDWRPGELFVHAVNGSDRSVNVDVVDASVAISFALQHGATLEDMSRAMLRGEDGRPHGFLGEIADAALALLRAEKAA